MAVFTTAERKDVLDYIQSLAEQNEHIKALILVGSGAFGYHDELSDLDMVVATDSNENIGAVMADVAARLQERMRFLYYKQAPQRRLQVFLSDQYLEIDIGYGAYTDASAIQEHWKVLFDKTGTVDEKMRLSWEKRKDAPRTDEYPRRIAECSDSVWHSLMHAAVAIRRNRYWRACAELENARNQYIGLLGCRYSLNTERGKDVDQLPQAERAVLRKTLVPDLTPDALWRSLAALTEAIYAEFERSGAQARVSRRHLDAYIDFCRGLSESTPSE